MAQIHHFPDDFDVRVDRDLAEIASAIRLVARGAARTVHLVNLTHAMEVAGNGAALASTMGVQFRVQRGDSAVEVIVGPRG